MPEDIFQTDDNHKRLSMKIKKDVFYEMSVFSSSSSSGFLFAAYMILAVIMGILSFVLLLMGGLANLIMFAFAIVCGLICAFFYFMAQHSKIEYDYTLTNGTLDIAKIINDKNRKKLVSVDVPSILEMQPITSNNFRRFFNDRSVKKVNMFLNKGTHLYYMAINKEGQKVVIVFEPDQQLVEYMKIFNPDNIIA